MGRVIKDHNPPDQNIKRAFLIVLASVCQQPQQQKQNTWARDCHHRKATTTSATHRMAAYHRNNKNNPDNKPDNDNATERVESLAQRLRRRQGAR